LIVGAAKSGTTSLYHYLNQHPEVFMAPVKEPDYFGGYHWKLPLRNIHGYNPELQIYQDWNEYLNLFDGAANMLKGEASPSTLFFHETSIPEIKLRLRDPKIIILLRDPVERAFSHYNFLKRDGKENLSFLNAIAAESIRMEENYHYGYYYESLGYYHGQVSNFMKSFTCRIWTFERLRSETGTVYKEICEYLGVSNTFEPNLTVRYNVSGTPKSSQLNTFLRKKNKFRDLIRPVIDGVLSKEKKAALLERLHQLNTGNKDPLSSDMRRVLASRYSEDVEMLSSEFDVDISSWRSFN